MLEPQTRAALTEQLAPPPGFQLSHAVATSFTLDLETALTVPLSFAARRMTADAGELGILDAIRRAADRIDIFAQAGELSMRGRSDLVAFLEPMVHPVTVRRGLFHPKVWFLEYTAGDEREYRFICASRNLTADRSWDVVVRLDGRAADKPTSALTTLNAPLVGLLRALPARSVLPLPEARRARIEALADRWRGIEWELPDGIHDLAFHAFGIGRRPRIDASGSGALIISPFLSDAGVRALRSGVRGPVHLVSRADSLDRLDPDSLDEWLRPAVLDDAAALSSDETHDGELSGLHAKMIVADRGWNAHVIAGSANATEAALTSNVEVMVELIGRKKDFGVERTLEALGQLIEPYETHGGADPDPREEAQRKLESWLRGLAGLLFNVRVLPGDPHSLAVWHDGEPPARDGVSLRWHLLGRPDLGGAGATGTEAQPQTLDGIPLADITPFIVLVAADREGNERSTILLARLLDDIETRRDAIIARQLTDRAAFIRLLMLMLEMSGTSISVAERGVGEAFFGSAGEGVGAGLFESLVRAVGAGRSGLSDVHRIVDYLATSSEGPDVLPEGFIELWSAVWDAHSLLTESKERV